MRKGTIAAKALTLLLAVGMLSQNVVTVYAAEEGGETPAETTYTITYQVEDAAQGIVRLNKDDAESKESDTETVTVTANEDGSKSYSNIVGATAVSADADQYTFVNWTAGDEVVATDASYKPSVETLSGDVIYTAHFSKKEPEDTVITINYAVDNGEAGSVSNDKDMQTNGEGTISGSTATANTGYKFVGWKKGAEEDYVSTDAAFAPSEWPSGDVTYTAYFEAEARTQEDDNLVPTNDAVPTVADGKAYVVST